MPWRMAGVAALYGAVFAAFVGYTEQQSSLRVRQMVEQHSRHLQGQVWDMSYQATAQYLTLVREAEDFRIMRVRHADGAVFVESTRTEAASPAESALGRLGLFPERSLRAPIVHVDRIIGYLEVVWISRNVYIYAYGLVILLLVLIAHTLGWFIYRARAERRQAERRLEISRRRLESVVSTAPVIVFSLDRAGVFEVCRGRALEGLGWIRDAFMGKTTAEVERAWPGLVDDFNRAVRGENFTVQRRIADRILEVRYGPMESDGSITGVLGVATDVTALEAALGELKERDDRLRQELDLAREIQSGLIPTRVPMLPGITLALLFRPSIELSGDVIHFVQSADRPQQLKIILSDITGHGVSAALLSMMFKAIAEEVFVQPRDPVDEMADLNQRLCRQFPESYFAATQLVELDGARRVMTYVNASQQSLLLFRDGAVIALREGGAAPGLIAPEVIPDMKYGKGVVELRRGDVLLLFTDGLVEVWNSAGEELGIERVAEWFGQMAGQPPAEALARLWDRVAGFAGSSSLPDDVAAVAIRVD